MEFVFGKRAVGKANIHMGLHHRESRLCGFHDHFDTLTKPALEVIRNIALRMMTMLILLLSCTGASWEFDLKFKYDITLQRLRLPRCESPRVESH